MNIRITDNPADSRFEAFVDDELAGFVTYKRQPGEITFVHTEVFSKWEGKGVGSAIARGVLDDARANALKVVPRCPFIKGYIDRHAEYQDLVAG